MTGVLDGKVAVVAGAGDGIGRATALAFARAGADVVLAARRPEPLEKLAGEVAALTGREAVAMPTDIADAAQCHRLVEAAADLLGRVDIVVNVATYNPSGRIEEIERDEFRRAFDVNVLGVLEVSRAALPYMRRVGGGSIVQISSAAPRMKLPGLGAYASTKAAMEIASATMAREVGPEGIRVNVVVAGYTDNAKLAAYIDEIAAKKGSTADEVRRDMAQSAALRRITRPEDIAETVLFLSGPGAAAITGTVTHVTSGVTLEP
ncbi:SDR family NAD(P)-dependent oxidoreductase [Yinghuangia sp. YIM S09857]|uniref:SDR family NAD(P)-dependent oxidoreductase n=1 Tax=Yinghuangia sp. YIM S09857 TaxID=3436929 RepID=UPI003F52FAA3